jgi:hypothetical protein
LEKKYYRAKVNWETMGPQFNNGEANEIATYMRDLLNNAHIDLLTINNGMDSRLMVELARFATRASGMID